jgi:gamma-glutamyltranspeptidase/glutathione hydrolase
VSTSNAVNRFGTYDLEKSTPLENMVEPLEALGYKVKLRALNSGLHAISITKDGLAGGADPRREGIALGQ